MLSYCPLNTFYAPPIERLPVELLSYIFLLGAYATEDLLEADGTERNLSFTSESVKTPLVISSVNRHWRHVALNTPSLWTSLCVTAEMVDAQPDHDMSSTTGVLNTGHLTTYLQRSHKYPLDILIDARDQDWDFSEPESVQFTSLLSIFY
jgi:hypothetical protein